MWRRVWPWASSTKVFLKPDRSTSVPEPGPNDAFCLYLWRTMEAPGTLYLAGDIAHATAVYNELVDDGYTVKVVHVATDTEYEMLDGSLTPVCRVVPFNSSPKLGHRQRPAQA